MLSAADRDRILKGQSSAARKVLECVPIEVSWTSKEIAREMGRRQQAMDFTILEGCLNTLKESGLVKEATRGQFSQSPVRRRAITVITPFNGMTKEESASILNPVLPATAMQDINAAKPKAKTSTIDRLEELAMKVTALSSEMAEVSIALQDAIIEVQAELEAQNDDSERLKQLRALLSGG